MPVDANYGSPAGELQTTLLPRVWKGDGTVPGVIFAHGAGGSANSVNPPAATPGHFTIVRTLADAGYPVACPNLGGSQTWGAPAVDAWFLQAVNDLQYIGARTGPVAVIGASMGGCNVFNYAKRNPTNVFCGVGIIPVSDLDDIRDNDRTAQGFRSAISTAWGTGPWTAPHTPPLPAGANPATYYAGALGIPWHFYYCSDDPICLPGTVTALAANLGQPATNLGALGHTEAAMAAVDMNEVIDLIEANT